MIKKMIQPALLTVLTGHLLWSASMAWSAGPANVQLLPTQNVHNAAPTPTVVAKTYTVSPGDTLDKVIRQQYASSPLRPEILRDAVVQQNQTAFAKGNPKVLMAGSVLTIPDHGELVRKLTSTTMPSNNAPQTASADNNTAASLSAEQRRSWIRYP
ncbi:MAG: hypothetical protein ACKVOY_19915 [Burkholderiaceae bacterium]